MRIWIDGVERALDADGWNLTVPDNGGSVTLSNSADGDVAQVDDGWRSTLAQLATDGLITFRVEHGPINYLRLNGLGAQVDPHRPTFDAHLREFDTGDYFYEAEWGEESQVWRLLSDASVYDGSEDDSVLPDIPLSAFTIGPMVGSPGWERRYLTYEMPITSASISSPRGQPFIASPTACVDDPANWQECEPGNTITITKTEWLVEGYDEPDYWEMAEDTGYWIGWFIYDFGESFTSTELISELNSEGAILTAQSAPNLSLPFYLREPLSIS